MLVLDSGAVSRLAQRRRRTAALVSELVAAGQWPPVVPTVVLVESLRGRPDLDVNVHRLLKGCIVEPYVPERLARRAAELRRRARRGSAVDAVVVAMAEPAGTVLTGDPEDLEALAAHADDVRVETI